MVARLTEHCGSDDIDAITLATFEPPDVSTLAGQVRTLTDMVQSFMNSVRQSSAAGAPVHGEAQLSVSTGEAQHDVNETTTIRGSAERSSVDVAVGIAGGIRDPVHSVCDVGAILPEFDPDREQLSSK